MVQDRFALGHGWTKSASWLVCVLWLGAQVANLVGRRRTLLAVASLFALAPLVSWVEIASVGVGYGPESSGSDIVCFPQCRTVVLGST